MASGDGEQETIADFPRRFRTPPRIMRRAAQVGLVAGRGTDFPVRGWGFSKPSAEMGEEDFMGRKIFRRTSPSFEVGLVVPFHSRRSGLGRRSTGLPETGAAICGALNLWE